METHFLSNNTHLRSVDDFVRMDPHLSQLQTQPYVFRSPIIDELPVTTPGIYNITGGRQIGKTTLLKQWMLHLLSRGTPANSIAFLSCELIVDEQSLYRIVTDQLDDMPSEGMLYLILDEITYVSGWDKAIKYLADTQALARVELIISGSDLVLMEEARKRFPGRRGKAETVDFHYYPLSFKQTVELKKKLKKRIDANTEFNEKDIQLLFSEFNEYLIHGGFLTAINEYATSRKISNRTLATYSDWIRGDMIKRGKKEHYLREILEAIIKHYSSQISWRNLVSALSVDHTQTVIDYVNLLASMDAVFVQTALMEDKLVGSPKKHRKLMFCDPFIYHAVRAWLSPTKNAFEEQIVVSIEDPSNCEKLVESVVTTHFRRHFPTYYIKAENEVDVAYVDQRRFYPIEIKWTNQLRPNDLKQILKYPNGQIWMKTTTVSQFQTTPVLPLPLALLSL